MCMCLTLAFVMIFASYGVVLKELSNTAGARTMLIKSLSLVPMLWSAWKELTKLCDDREMVGHPSSM